MESSKEVKTKQLVEKIKKNKKYNEKYISKKSILKKVKNSQEFSNVKLIRDDGIIELKTNEYTKKPIKTTYGYEIILKTGEEEKPKLEDKEEEIRNKLREQALNEDAKLYYNSLVKLREDKGIKWNDSKLEKAYKEYNENQLKNNSNN